MNYDLFFTVYLKYLQSFYKVVFLLIMSTVVCQLQLVVIVVVSLCCLVSPQNETTDDIQVEFKEISLYRNLFKVKRKEHLAAIQSLLLEKDISKQATLIKVMMKTIIETLYKAMLNLDSLGYDVGQDFPQEPTVKDDLSKVLENVALFTDIIVRFPEPAHIFYKKNHKKWKKVMNEAITICSNSGVFSGDYETLLHNLKQELGIGPKDDEYKNPFLKRSSVQDELTTEERKEIYKDAKKKKKLKEKKKRGGPTITARVDL